MPETLQINLINYRMNQVNLKWFFFKFWFYINNDRTVLNPITMTMNKTGVCKIDSELY